MNIDWNPVVHILDELSEGTHSLLELSHSKHHYREATYLDALLFLVDRRLIEFTQGLVQPEEVSSEQWGQRLRDAFGDDATAPHLLTQTSVDLTNGGEELLRLLNIGHPPYSSASNGS